MDPCTKKCPPVKSIGFTGEPPGNSWFRNMAHAVDGLEIRGSPVEVGSLSHYLQGFIHPRWVFGISEPSTVCFWPSEIPKFEDAKPILEKFSLLYIRFSAFGTSPRQENIKL